MLQTVQVEKLYNFLDQILDSDTSKCGGKTASDWIDFGQKGATIKHF